MQLNSHMQFQFSKSVTFFFHVVLGYLLTRLSTLSTLPSPLKPALILLGSIDETL